MIYYESSFVSLCSTLFQEDMKTIKSLKKEIEKAWKMVDTAQETINNNNNNSNHILPARASF